MSKLQDAPWSVDQKLPDETWSAIWTNLRHAGWNPKFATTRLVSFKDDTAKITIEVWVRQPRGRLGRFRRNRHRIVFGVTPHEDLSEKENQA